MNLSASQCGTSGCESGWTFYLDQSSYSQTRCQNFGENLDVDYGVKGASFLVEDEDEDEEESLSMVSDASSGPIHYHVECLDGNESFCSHHSNTEPAKKTSKNKTKIKQHHSNLDDTASSPVISFSEKNFKEENSIESLDFSQGFSGTHFKGKSSFGFLKSGTTSTSKHAGKKQGMTKG